MMIDQQQAAQRDDYADMQSHASIDEQHDETLHPRLAWMMCYKQTRNAQKVCQTFGISRKTFYKWLKRYQQSNGDAASLTDRSRRPHRFPRATPESSIQLLRQVREQTGFGQRRLRTYLAENYNISLSERTIWKILKRSNGSGLMTKL